MKHTQRTPMGLLDFHDTVVRPALEAGLDRAFPEFGFVPKSGGWWKATKAPPGFEDYGVREGKLTANRRGVRSFKTSRVFVLWEAYVLGRHADDMPAGRDYYEAVVKLAGLLGLDASVLDRGRTPEQLAKEEAKVCTNDLLEDFHELLNGLLNHDEPGPLKEKGDAARAYLRGRGFSPEYVADNFGLVSSPDEVIGDLLNMGWTAEELKAAGVTGGDGNIVNHWRGRITFPWRDTYGRVITMGGRDITVAVEPAKKYVYLAVSRGDSIFGLNSATRSATFRREGLVVVESPMAAMLFESLGMDNVVALGGAGNLLTSERWKTLARVKPHSITLVLDNDKPKANGARPGLEALETAVDNLNRADLGLNVYVVDPDSLGQHKGPDDYAQALGIKAFRDLLANRRPWVTWRAMTLLGPVTPASPEAERRDATIRVLDFVEAVGTPRATLDRDLVVGLLAERTGFTHGVLLQEVTEEADRRRQDKAKNDLIKNLKTAGEDLAEGEDLASVTADISDAITAARVHTEDPPPELSVERWLEGRRVTPTGFRSGWAGLDALNVRFSPGELSLVAGRTGHGKTSAMAMLLLQWLRGEDPDARFIFYSHEEPEDRVIDRLVALLTWSPGDNATGGRGWTANEIRAYLQDPGATNEYAQDGYWPDIDKLEASIDIVRGWEQRLQVVHRPKWDAIAIGAHAKTMAETEKVSGIFVDYLQRLPHPAGVRVDRRDQEVSFAGRELKSLAVNLGVPVVVGGQINREAVKSTNTDATAKAPDFIGAMEAIRKGRPQLHHLREGGSEQEADLVLGFLNYAADFQSDAREGAQLPPATLFEVGVLKNRTGVTGAWAPLAFEGRFGIIRDVTPWESKTWTVKHTPKPDRSEKTRANLELKVDVAKAKEGEAREKRWAEEAKARKAEAEAHTTGVISFRPKR